MGLKATPPEDSAAVTAFEVRLATTIGIDPAKYTAAEVAELYAERIGHDRRGAGPGVADVLLRPARLDGLAPILTRRCPAASI